LFTGARVDRDHFASDRTELLFEFISCGHERAVLVEEFLVFAIINRVRIRIGWSYNREFVPTILALYIAADVRSPHAQGRVAARTNRHDTISPVRRLG
jgi:hypothetical protein